MTQPHLGLVAGYDFQAGSVVFGLSGDLEYLGNRKVTFSRNPLDSRVNDTMKVDWSGHILGRVGYDLSGWLLYAIGGAAFAHFKASHTGQISPTELFTWRLSNSRVGYDYGAGVERRFGNGFSLRAEGLYDYWGAKRYDWVPGQRYSNIAAKILTFRIGLVKRFGPASP
jgi:outer membrane immunogenic protein